MHLRAYRAQARQLTEGCLQVDTADLLVLSVNTAPLLAPASLPLRQVIQQD